MLFSVEDSLKFPAYIIHHSLCAAGLREIAVEVREMKQADWKRLAKTVAVIFAVIVIDKQLGLSDRVAKAIPGGAV